jgi:hypothetical protein
MHVKHKMELVHNFTLQKQICTWTVSGMYCYLTSAQQTVAVGGNYTVSVSKRGSR